MEIGKPSLLPCFVDFTPDSCKVGAHILLPHATPWLFSREVAGVTTYFWLELDSDGPAALLETGLLLPTELHSP